LVALQLPRSRCQALGARTQFFASSRMVNLSAAAIEAMGFRPFGPESPIRATFYSVHIYHAQGIVAEAGTLIPLQGAVGDIAYKAALGSSVNDIAGVLLGDKYTDDEETWSCEHRCRPPYLMVQLGPTVSREVFEGYIMEANGNLITYNCFAGAQEELSRLESRVIPSLLSALDCVFGTRHPPVSFPKVDRIWFGITEAGRTLQDVRVVASGTGYVSSRVPPEEVATLLANAGVLAGRMNAKITRFFHLALEESDPLKRFLYFFLSIEIATHATFASIDHSASLAAVLLAPQRLRMSLPRLFGTQREKWTALRDRFIWCVLCSWTHLTDDDVDAFGRLKAVRDKIAHGSIAAPPTNAVREVQSLAARLFAGM
jgi:hypothetical protein